MICNQCKLATKNLYKMKQNFYCGDCLAASLTYASGVIDQRTFERDVWISRYNELEQKGLNALFSTDLEDELKDFHKN